MSSMRTFDSTTTLTVSEGYDLTNQQHYSKRRCRCSCSNFLTKKCTFRVWHILLFLFIIALIMAIMGLLLAMYGPGTTDLKYSARSGTDSPGVVEPTAKAATTAKEDTTTTGKETTPVKPSEQQTTLGTTQKTTQVTTGQTTADTTTKPPSTTKAPTTTAPTTTKLPTTTAEPTTTATTPKTTGQTTAGTTTKPPSTTKAPTTTAPPTTQPPPTTVPSNKNFLECGVAIVGGGTGGLLMAYALLESKDKTNETNVCVFEREDRLGGKIFDFNFTQAPDVVVGLGEWNIHGDNYNEIDLESHLSIQTELWAPKTHRVEARGVFTDSFDSLKSKAFPTLLDRVPMNNKTLEGTAEFIYDDARNYTQFSTAETFLSYELSPEGAKLMEDRYGFLGDYMQAINPLSYRTYLKKKDYVIGARSDDKRPKKGMSEFITNLADKVRSRGGKIYLKETVTSINKEEDKLVLQTTNFTVKANKTVITTGPTALKKVKGDVMQNITGHEIFKSIVSVPAFHGAAVYERAWWNDSIVAKKNNSLRLQPLDMFISSSNCLGITMPYKSLGPNGRAVLHTIGNNGGCSDKWGEILQISSKEVDKELKRALQYKFQREDVPDPLETKYKYWDEGFWFLQKPGANFSLATVQQWAKRPLTGQDVFLVDRAFYSFGGWLDDTIQSSLDALKEGWNLEFSL